MQFSEISTTGKLPKRKENETIDLYKLRICAMAMGDRAKTAMYKKCPDNFGDGMIEVGYLLGVSADPEGLNKWHNQYKQSKGIS